jgi:hypothetical protein
MERIPDMRGCPARERIRQRGGVVLSTNLNYLRHIKINELALAANMRKVIQPDEMNTEDRYGPWFAPDDELAQAAAIRQEAYALAPERVLQTANDDPAVRAASAELLRLQSSYLAERFPDSYTINGNLVRNNTTSDSFNIYPGQSDLHPLAAVGLLGQEDICVVEQLEDRRHTFVAGFVASPTDWNLPEFIGLDMDQVHRRFDGYEAALKKTVDRTLSSLPPFPGRQIARNNLFLYLDPSLAIIPGEQPTFHSDDITDPGSQIFLRSEYETLTRLPHPYDRYIIFTIKPHVYPLSVVKQERGEEFAAAIGTNSVLHRDDFAGVALDYLTVGKE